MKIINKQPIAFLQNLEKAFYKDNYQNRKLGRVGRPYAHKEDAKENEKSWDKIEAFYKKGSDESKLWDSWYKFQKSGDHSHISDMRQIFEKKFPDIESWKQTSPNTGKAKLTALNKDGDKIASIKLDGDKVDLAALQTFMDKCHVGKGETEVLVDKTETLKNTKGKKLDAIIKYSNSAEKEGVKGIKVADDATDEEKKIAIAKFYKEAAEGDADNLDEIIEEALADYISEKKDIKLPKEVTIVDGNHIKWSGNFDISNWQKKNGYPFDIDDVYFDEKKNQYEGYMIIFDKDKKKSIPFIPNE